jgi:hypothetical protein
VNDLSTYAYPFVLSIIALVAGWLLLGRVTDGSGSFPRTLFGVGIAGAMIGFVLLWVASRS